MTNFTKGQSITMRRTRSGGGPKPKIDKIIWRFITNTDSEIQAIRGGEVDMIYPQPQLQLASLKGQAGLKYDSSKGATFEHLEINTSCQGLRARPRALVPAARSRTRSTVRSS